MWNRDISGDGRQQWTGDSRCFLVKEISKDRGFRRYQDLTCATTAGVNPETFSSVPKRCPCPGWPETVRCRLHCYAVSRWPLVNVEAVIMRRDSSQPAG
jgi:hypothetical protein